MKDCFRDILYQYFLVPFGVTLLMTFIVIPTMGCETGHTENAHTEISSADNKYEEAIEHPTNQEALNMLNDNMSKSSIERLIEPSVYRSAKIEIEEWIEVWESVFAVVTTRVNPA